jgi:hypothetical protein
VGFNRLGLAVAKVTQLLGETGGKGITIRKHFLRQHMHSQGALANR